MGGSAKVAPLKGNLVPLRVNVVSPNVQERDAFLIEEDEFNSVRVADPECVRLFVLAVQLVRSQGRIEGIFPEGKFLFLGFFFRPLRQFSVVPFKQACHPNVLQVVSKMVIFWQPSGHGFSRSA